MSEKKTAGALDIRNIIGGLLGVYGVVLLITGIVNSDGGPKSADVNSNLWAGIVLLVVGLVFLAWARLRPVVVAEDAVAAARNEDDRGPHGEAR